MLAFVSLLSVLILLSAFMLLVQKRMLGLVNILAGQSTLLAIAAAWQAFVLSDYLLYVSAILTLVLKAVMIPKILRRLIGRLAIERESYPIAKPFYVLLMALMLVLFSDYLVSPIHAFASVHAKNVVVVATAVMLLGMFVMIIRREAIAHVVGFIEMENGLFFAALMATQGMPMIVELGIAFDVLVIAILFGVFFFHIRTSIDSLDVDRLNLLREDKE
jgi:hydrogenase-4 component E